MISSSGTAGAGDRPDPISGDEVVICPDLEGLGGRAALLFARSAEEAVARQGRFAVALSGGSTPRRLYQSLARPELAEKIPWRRVHLFWGDERVVPPDHPDSNYRMAHEALIAHIPIPPENVHRMPGEEHDLEKGARAYEKTLRAFFQPSADEWTSFDLILLGVGSDGHTASLFPGSPALEEPRRWVAAVDVKSLQAARLTLTLPVLNHARQVGFLAAGKEKGPILREILSEKHSRTDLPAQKVRPRNGRRIFLLDQEAAALIGEGP